LGSPPQQDIVPRLAKVVVSEVVSEAASGLVMVAMVSVLVSVVVSVKAHSTRTFHIPRTLGLP
jgi:hypothetical protein